jgi:hypothetical protein
VLAAISAQTKSMLSCPCGVLGHFWSLVDQSGISDMLEIQEEVWPSNRPNLRKEVLFHMFLTFNMFRH